MTINELPNSDAFDALEQSRRDAAVPPNPEEARYMEWTGARDNPDLRTTAGELAGYLEARPYSDSAGNIHDPNTGKFVDPSRYNEKGRDRHYADSMAEESYESMSMSSLAKALGQAELDSDKTKAEDISDVLLEKMSVFADSARTERSPDGMSSEAQDKLFARIMKIKDLYKESHRNDGQKEGRMADSQPDHEPITIAGRTVGDGGVADTEEQPGHPLDVEFPDGRVVGTYVPDPETGIADERVVEDPVPTQEMPATSRTEAAERITFADDRSAFRRRLSRASGSLKDLYSQVRDRAGARYNASREWLKAQMTDKENAKRNKILAGAVGTVVVAAVAYWTYKGAYDIFSSGSGHNIANTHSGMGGGHKHHDKLADALGAGKARHGHGTIDPTSTTMPTQSPQPNPNADTSVMPWTYAHNLHPNNPTAAMQQALDKYNAANGTHFALTPSNGTVEIIDGGHVMDSSEAQALNSLMS